MSQTLAVGRRLEAALASWWVFLSLLPVVCGLLEGAPVMWPVSFAALIAAIGCLQIGCFERLFSLAPLIGIGIIFSIAHRDVGDRYLIWTFRELLAIVVWAAPGSVLLNYFATSGNEKSALVGWLMAAGLATLGALDLARNGFFEAVTMENGVLVRTNPLFTVRYFGFLDAHNIIIGVFPPTILGAAGLLVGFQKGAWWERVSFLFLGITALVPSIVMGTRTLVLTITVLCIVRTVHFLWRRGNGLVVVASCIFVSCALAATLCWLQQYEFGEMMTRRVLEIPEDPRIDGWIGAIGALGKSPLYNGMRYFYQLQWAHNVLLDVALTAGTPAALVLFVSWIWTGRHVYLLYSNGLMRVFDTILAWSTIVSVITSQVMPPIRGLFALQVLACFYFSLRWQDETRWLLNQTRRTPQRLKPSLNGQYGQPRSRRIT